MRETSRSHRPVADHPRAGRAAAGVPHGAAAGAAHLPYHLPSLVPVGVALVLLMALAGCVKELQPRGVVLRELDSGYTASNGGGERYLGNQVSVGVTTRVQ